MFHPHFLLHPAQCGPLTLKNRIVAAPIVTGLEYRADFTLLRDFWLDIARDGASMVTIAAGIVADIGRPVRSLHAFNDLDAARHRPVTSALHEADCRVILQLIHAGPNAEHWFAASTHHGVTGRSGRHAHRASDWRIRRTIKSYADTAEKAIAAGYDGVEVLASGQSFPATFLSRSANFRKDAWGINQLARFKLALDIVRSIRKRIGPDKAIGFRFNLIELTPKGAPWEEILRLVQMLRIAGVDYLCADFGGFEERIPTAAHSIPPGIWNPAYEALAQSTALPVVFGHNFGSLSVANKLAEVHENALFELSEEYLGDRSYLYKSLGLNEASIRPWIYHHQCGSYNDFERTAPFFSLTNPADFNRYAPRMKPAVRPKHILVVGAGLAGIHFSLFAARRGHFVRLFESDSKIGGKLNFIAKVQQSENIERWLKILDNDLKLAGVEIHLREKATIQDLLNATDIDLFAIAAGSETNLPDIAGIDSSNVLTVDDVLGLESPVGNRVAVLGVNPTSLALCRYLLETDNESGMSAEDWRKAWGVGNVREHAGGVLGFVPEISEPLRRVYLLETERGQVARIRNHPHYQWDLKWLLMRGVQLFDDCNIEAIDNYSVRVSSGDRHTDRFTVRIDHVVVCSEGIPKEELSMRLAVNGRDCIRLGAAARDNGFITMREAVEEAIEAALNV